jgi:HPt (histidine-containing phosphotransfer) domain-containing protein
MSDQSLVQIDQILLTFPTVDQTKIDTMLSYDPSKQLLKELVKIFNVEVPDKMNLIKNEFTAKNFPELSKLAHRIRSTSLNLGTTRLAEIFKRLEYLSLEQNVLISEIQFLIQAAEKEYAFASERLHEFMNSKTEGTV